MSAAPAGKASSSGANSLGAWLGLALPWAGTWLLLGLRALPVLAESPHPFLSELKLTGVMLQAVAEWAGLALLGHLFLGWLLGWPILALLRPGERHGRSRFRPALLISAGLVLLFHGWLYLQVPAALASLPILRRLPFSLTFAGLFAAGGFIVWLALPKGRARMVAVPLAIALTGALTWLPHDLIRRWAPAAAPLPAEEPRLLLLSFDALRKDTFEAARPDWALPPGVQAVGAAPSTRMAWDTYFGADPGPLLHGLLVPTYTEWTRPERLKLVDFARSRNARSAFLINDSLSLHYGLGPHLFNEVLEAGAGWKYWMTLGYGTCWPVFSFLQNFASPIETTNPWADSASLWRDVDRALERNHWLSVHACDLHPPIRMNLPEFMALHSWRWLLRAPNRYRPYENGLQVIADRGARLGPDSDAFPPYVARSRRMLQEAAPWVNRWSVRYPTLSGVLTSDHGEQFRPIRGADGQVKSNYTGIHGFNPPTPEDIAVPLHPFGATTTEFAAGETVSWLDLRDATRSWLTSGGPLHLKSRSEGWRIDLLAVRADHLEESPLAAAPGVRADGLHPDDYTGKYLLHPSGLWLARDDMPKTLESIPVYSAISTGSRWDFFFPIEGKAWEHRVYQGDQLVSSGPLEERHLQEKLSGFSARRAVPVSFQEPSPSVSTNQARAGLRP